jgi:hypothetical protein
MGTYKFNVVKHPEYDREVEYGLIFEWGWKCSNGPPDSTIFSKVCDIMAEDRDKLSFTSSNHMTFHTYEEASTYRSSVLSKLKAKLPKEKMLHIFYCRDEVN